MSPCGHQSLNLSFYVKQYQTFFFCLFQIGFSTKSWMAVICNNLLCCPFIQDQDILVPEAEKSN